MKKLYTLLLSFFILSAAAFSADAKSLTVKWDNPGAVKLCIGSLSHDPYIPSSDATSYTIDTDDDYIYVAVLPADGYALVKGTNNSTSNAYKNCRVQTNATYGQLISCSYYASTLATMGDTPTLTIETTKVTRDETFTVDVENGAACINAVFSTQLMYSPDLSNGTNTVHFNPEFDTDLNIFIIPGFGAKEIYKLELNGKAISYSSLWGCWHVGAIKAGDKLTIRVFEGEEPVIEYSTLTIDAPTGTVSNVRNFTTQKFMELPADGKLSVPNGSDIRVILNREDFDYTAFTLDGKNITSSFNAELGYIQFTVDHDATLKIEAEEIIWPDVTLTAYIMNPEGVRLNLGYFETDDHADLTDGTPQTSDLTFTTTITYEDEDLGTVTQMKTYVLNAALTQSFKVKVNAKRPNVFVSPLPGYYIKAVLAWDEDEVREVGYVACNLAQPKSYSFYVIAEKFIPDAKLDVNLLGDYKVRILPDTHMSLLWGNPDVSFNLKKGLQTLDFLASYSLPFTFGSAEQFLNLEAFYNGVIIEPNEEGYYDIPYVQPSDPELVPMLTVNNTGKIQSQGTLAITGDDNATVTYGPVKTPAVSPYTYLVGTSVSVKPSDPSLSVAVNGEPVEGVDGVYTFAVVKNMNNVLIAENAGVESVAAQAPALSYDGTTVSAPGADIEVYALTGACIAKAHAAFDASRLPKGIFIVKAAGHTLKIVRR